MKISENDLILHYDEKEQKIIVYMLTFEALPEIQKILLTEYPMSQLKTYEIKEAGRILGENILIFLSGTRKIFLDEKNKNE